MDTIASILTQFPKCRVTINARSRPSRPKPREYDEKVTKSRGTLIRIQRRVGRDGQLGIGMVHRNGRPVWMWVKEENLLKCHRDDLAWARTLRRREGRT